MADGSGGKPPPDHGRTAQAAAQVASDWITIWQSELAAMASNRELRDGWLRLVDLWADTAQRATRLLPGADDGSSGGAGAAAPIGAASAMAAFDARDAAIDRLAKRVEELERQLGQLAAGLDIPGGPSRA